MESSGVIIITWSEIEIHNSVVFVHDHDLNSQLLMHSEDNTEGKKIGEYTDTPLSAYEVQLNPSPESEN